jgi:hypothetical protein
MVSTSTTVGEVVAPTSPAEVSTPSVVCREEPALVSVTGGEVVNPYAIPRVGVEVRASASVSPMTCDSGDLVREGDDRETGTPCGLATFLHGKILRVGDSPRGPHKQLGNPRLKPAIKPNTLYITMQDMAHAAETPAAHQGGPLEDPLEQASPRSRMRA